jgi:hypothetical protein
VIAVNLTQLAPWQLKRASRSPALATYQFALVMTPRLTNQRAPTTKCYVLHVRRLVAKSAFASKPTVCQTTAGAPA